MTLGFLYNIFQENKDAPALIFKNQTHSYQWLLQSVKSWSERLKQEQILSGSVVEIGGDFSPNSISLLLALIEHDCIIVPFSNSVSANRCELRSIAEIENIISIDQQECVTFDKLERKVSHPLLITLKTKHHPGLILFSSGSTGNSKAAVHDFIPLLDKFRVSRGSKRIIPFLLFDHIGGINTLLHSLSNAGCVVILGERSPTHVCRAIQEHKVQVLPTSPTFINLLLLSEAYKDYDLSSLELVTYGTEVMPEATLHRLNKLFPQVKIAQTYGLSELGILRAKSKASDSLYMKVGGEGYETRINDGMLEIRAKSAMLGYLNAPDPFTADGWFKTGDIVEGDGDYIRIMGRKSEIINVGGEKVYPSQVESVLQTMAGVEDVVVSGENNSLVGQIVRARVKLATAETTTQFRQRMWEFCKDKLATFMIPQKVFVSNHVSYGARFKRMRNLPYED